jgi:hypothetical protein
MSLIRIYLLAKTFVFRNEHFRLVFKLKTIVLKIRAQESWSFFYPDIHNYMYFTNQGVIFTWIRTITHSLGFMDFLCYPNFTPTYKLGLCCQITMVSETFTRKKEFDLISFPS